MLSNNEFLLQELTYQFVSCIDVALPDGGEDGERAGEGGGVDPARRGVRQQPQPLQQGVHAVLLLQVQAGQNVGQQGDGRGDGQRYVVISVKFYKITKLGLGVRCIVI